jgi:hypothetical protein
LKLPISRGVVGSLRQLLGKSLSALIDGQIHGVFRIPGILSSTRLAERTTPNPEGVCHRAHRRLANDMP